MAASIPDRLHIDPSHEIESIGSFLRDALERFGRNGVVIGLSGGLGSSTIAHIATRSLPKGSVIGLLLPERDNNPLNIAHAGHVAASLGIRHSTIDITPILESLGVYGILPDPLRQSGSGLVGLIGSLSTAFNTPSAFAYGVRFLYGPRSTGVLAGLERNMLLPVAQRFMAFAITKTRVRTILLEQAAATANALVVCTTDRSEHAIGFYDPHGDGAGDIAPLRHLYKTQIREVARAAGVPADIVDKPSSGDLLAHLPNETAIGFTYERLDAILAGMDLGMTDGEIVQSTRESEDAVAVIRQTVAVAKLRVGFPLTIRTARD